MAAAQKKQQIPPRASHSSTNLQQTSRSGKSGRWRDAELKQAIAVAKQRADAARASQPEVDKAVADKKAAVDATAPELASTTAKVQDIVAKLQPIHQSLSAADATMVANRLKWSEACNALKFNEKAKTRHEW